jgi:hypothetical protein
MTHYGLLRVGAVPCSIGVGKTVEGLKVAGLDGLQPSLLDWKAHACMVKPYKRGNAGQVKAVGIKGGLGGQG